jgi:hypothetical protein
MACSSTRGLVTSSPSRPHSSRVLQSFNVKQTQKVGFTCVRSDAFAPSRRHMLLVMASTASQQQLGECRMSAVQSATDSYQS